MKNLFIVPAVGLGLIMASCGGGDLPAEAATKMCECGGESATKVLELTEAAGNSETTDEMLEISASMKEKSLEVIDCVDKIQKEYKGKMTPEEIKTAISKECPDVMTVIDKLMNK
jgi:hypothetical protein